MFRKSIGAVLLQVLLLAAGCATTDTKEVSAKDFKPETGSVLKESRSKLAAGDELVIAVEVDGVMEVESYQVEINGTGKVTLPLVGDVRVAQMTLDDARSRIEMIYGSYYVSKPVIILSRVDTQVNNQWGFVTVTGAVTEAGRISIPSAKGIKLTAVISECGGFSPTAKISDIRVTRKKQGGEKIRVTIDYSDIGEQGDADSDISLFNGDIVYVPQRIF